MSSLKKKFDLALKIVNGEIEDKDFALEECVNSIKKIIEACGDKDLTVRCCFESWKEGGKTWIKCDSYCAPEDEFKKICKECYKKIVKEFPKIEEAYLKLKR